MAKTQFGGLLVPVVTPFDKDYAPDREAFVSICRWLLDNGAHGLAVFGTTSEANSLTVTERMSLLEALVEAGVPAERLMPGVGMSALGDTIALTRHAVGLGCGGVLSLPPFYYKPVSVEGLYAWYAAVIEAVGSADLGLWLYHIPQMSGVAIPHDLIERLSGDFPETVLGIKDSSGDWSNTEAILRRSPGFRVFPSSEGVLVKAHELGGVGCITASGNINPAGIRRLFDALGTPEAEALQAEAAEIRRIFSEYPLIPAAKGVLSAELADERLATLRPPLLPLPAEDLRTLRARLAEAGWRVPGGAGASA
ncbi:dihydrodipicolinate synthase family protein [Chelativorans sp. M5D2P16]|uniref:dihydrodipicolinate synthase family protein n=1 Tax=Chelativorans sp. M5D2P16 TaxID=3095678 RepID=UPI002ACAEB5C|nr:dihydrodipicolinate synthase family protein [Chelativorans sp. M5D2P16]MDZ5696623.1 dihydrodipicolinate synthase family protein [Chelativorans sp. M5D2P16]